MHPYGSGPLQLSDDPVKQPVADARHVISIFRGGGKERLFAHDAVHLEERDQGVDGKIVEGKSRLNASVG